MLYVQHCTVCSEGHRRSIRYVFVFVFQCPAFKLERENNWGQLRLNTVVQNRLLGAVVCVKLCWLANQKSLTTSFSSAILIQKSKKLKYLISLFRNGSLFWTMRYRSNSSRKTFFPKWKGKPQREKHSLPLPPSPVFLSEVRPGGAAPSFPWGDRQNAVVFKWSTTEWEDERRLNAWWPQEPP